MSDEGSEQGGVQYQDVGSGYFETRRLRRHARVGSLWSLGVGAVISGDFFGWNFGLAAGGFGGLLVATGIITLMYAGLCFSIAERSPALPWAAAYAAFVGLNVWGVEASLRFTVAITLLAVGILLVFYVGAFAQLDLAQFAFTVAPEQGRSRFLPHGVAGIVASLPFAIWFYLAIEELPLAAEESHDPQADMPRGILYGLLTLVVCAFATLIASVGIAPGAAELGTSDEPLFLGLRTIFGPGLGTRILALVAVAGLVASFHTIIFAYGRQVLSLSRAGYFPQWLSRTHPTRETPARALVAGAGMGYAVALASHGLGPEHPVGAVLLNGVLIWYVLGLLYFAFWGRGQLVHSPEEAFAKEMLAEARQLCAEGSRSCG